MVRAYVTPAHGKRRALARARHLAFLGRARSAPDATITLDFALDRLAGRHREARRLSRKHARNLDRLRRSCVFAARVAGADAKGRRARGQLSRLCSATRWRPGAGEGDFLALLSADKEVGKHLSAADLKAGFDFDFDFATSTRFSAACLGAVRPAAGAHFAARPSLSGRGGVTVPAVRLSRSRMTQGGVWLRTNQVLNSYHSMISRPQRSSPRSSLRAHIARER